jgi:molecular chaperone GrpE (heat shock protein)
LDIGPSELNYFNYFTEIEDAFIRRRGKHLLLSPMDWALIESWKEMDVPLHVALRGIEKSFDSWESKPRKRSVKSLLYCQEEVEAQFAEWRESRVGAPDDSDESTAQAQSGVQEASESLPFSRAAIVEHLQRGQTTLAETRKQRLKEGEDDLTDALQRAVARLGDLEKEFATAALPHAQKLEQSLSGVERMLSDSIRSVVESGQLERIEREVKDQLKPYRKQMEAEVYQQTFDNLLLKRLREQFGIPRLSLFYL